MAEHLAVSNLKKLGFTEHLDFRLINNWDKITNELVPLTLQSYLDELLGRISDRYSFNLVHEALRFNQIFWSSLYNLGFDTQEKKKLINYEGISLDNVRAGVKRDSLREKLNYFIFTSLLEYTSTHSPNFAIAETEYTDLFCYGESLQQLVSNYDINNSALFLIGQSEGEHTIYFFYDSFLVCVQGGRTTSYYSDSFNRSTKINIFYKQREDLNPLFQNKALLASEFTQVLGNIKSTKIHSYSSFATPFQQIEDKVITAVAQGQPRHSVLMQGESGIGKTSLANRIAHRLSKDYGFFTLYLSPAYLKQFSFDLLPYNKVCIIVNEGDTLALNRDFDTTKTTNTEEILALFDGTVTEVIEPFSKSIAPETNQLVTLITCNSTDKLDPAFLQSHRLDQIVEL